MFKWIFTGRKQKSIKKPDGFLNEDDLSPKPTTTALSLSSEFSFKPEDYGDGKIETDGVEMLVTSFKKEEGVTPLLKKLAGWVSELWAEYNKEAHEILAKAANVLRQTIMPMQIGEATDSLRNNVQWILSKKATRLAEVQRLLAQARSDLRALAIGIFGSPDRVAVIMDPRTEMIVSAAIMAPAIALEFFVNFGVIQWATDDNTSGAFSLIAGVVASITAHLAADAKRQEFAYADAMTENKRWLEELRGTDPVTKKKPEKPFPLPARLHFQSVLGHSLWISLCLGVLLIRGAIVAQRGNWGQLAGSFGFVILVSAYYLFKVTRKGAHARVDEYVKKEEEIKEYEKELKTISDPLAEDTYTKGIVKAFSEYQEATGTKKITEAIAKAKADLIYIKKEVEGARGFFLGILRRSDASLCKSINDLHGESAAPNWGEIEKMLISPNPLAHDNQTIAHVLSEAEKPMIGKSAINMHTLTREVWASILEEQRRMAAEEARQAADIRKADARERIMDFRPTKKRERE